MKLRYIVVIWLVLFTLTVFTTVAIVLHEYKEPERRLGTRTYYAKDKYILAYVRGEYLGDCFIPSMNVLRRLNHEQIDSIVLVETIPDIKGRY